MERLTAQVLKPKKLSGLSCSLLSPWWFGSLKRKQIWSPELGSTSAIKPEGIHFSEYPSGNSTQLSKMVHVWMIYPCLPVCLLQVVTFYSYIKYHRVSMFEPSLGHVRSSTLTEVNMILVGSHRFGRDEHPFLVFSVDFIQPLSGPPRRASLPTRYSGLEYALVTKVSWSYRRAWLPARARHSSNNLDIKHGKGNFQSAHHEIETTYLSINICHY